MLPPASLPMPPTWRDLLEEVAPVFARRSTRRLFVALACGMILADRSTVVAMTAAAGMANRWRQEPGSGKAYDLGIFTLDTDAGPAATAERYSRRWPIEPSNATGKQLVGVGDACNRVQKAVERTVPFGFLAQTLLIL
jgi:hypothetical protein